MRERRGGEGVGGRERQATRAKCNGGENQKLRTMFPPLCVVYVDKSGMRRVGSGRNARRRSEHLSNRAGHSNATGMARAEAGRAVKKTG